MVERGTFMDIKPDRHDAFMRLFIEHQPRIYAYLRTLVFNRTDAEELLQEVASVLWRKFDAFEPGTHFDRWAYRIVFHQVQYYRQQRARDRMCFSPELMATLADETQEKTDTFDAERAALHECIGKLPDQDRELVRQRYEPAATNRSVAHAVGRSESAVSRALSRIYVALLECIRRKLDAGGQHA
ncbi:MAG: sigma-70 family RNA polymerase sigma factor [Planctomycetes bacterium]|nr:sigma-70 family RNA polymerase sigma factor [Planctomycetota bacterium]